MNLFPVIISALFQFCIGLGWYDGYSYHIFSNKYLKKHKPRNYYHSSTFPLWRKHYFWRKRRIAEDGSRLISNNILLVNQLSASKRFLQYSPYFQKYFGAVRSKPKTETKKPRSKHKFNSFNQFRTDFNTNAFVRRNFVRPPYYQFYFQSPSMYLSHNNDLHDSNVGRIQSGRSEIEDALVNIALKTAEKPSSKGSFKSLSTSLGNSVSSELNTENIATIPKQDNEITIMKEKDTESFSKLRTESKSGQISGRQRSDFKLQPLQADSESSFKNTFTQDDVFGTFIDSDNGNAHAGKVLHSEISLDREIEVEQNMRENKGTLSDNSFGKIKHFTFGTGNLNLKNFGKTKPQDLNPFGIFKEDDNLSLNNNGISGNNTRSRSNFEDERNNLGFKTSTSPDKTLFNPTNINLHDEPFVYPNQDSRSSQFSQGFNTDGGGFSDHTNAGFGTGGGYFEDLTEEGSFNNDQTGCDGITTRKCVSDSECSCYGSFFCIDGMCKMITAKNYDETGVDDTANDQFWHR